MKKLCRYMTRMRVWWLVIFSKQWENRPTSKQTNFLKRTYVRVDKAVHKMDNMNCKLKAKFNVRFSLLQKKIPYSPLLCNICRFIVKAFKMIVYIRMYTKYSFVPNQEYPCPWIIPRRSLCKFLLGNDSSFENFLNSPTRNQNFPLVRSQQDTVHLAVSRLSISLFSPHTTG